MIIFSNKCKSTHTVTQKKLIKQLNKDIDIPLINEKTEQKILDKVYETIISTIKNIELD